MKLFRNQISKIQQIITWVKISQIFFVKILNKQLKKTSKHTSAPNLKMNVKQKVIKVYKIDMNQYQSFLSYIKSINYFKKQKKVCSLNPKLNQEKIQEIKKISQNMDFNLKILLGTIANDKFFKEYRIIRQISKGTFSITYEIQHIKTQKHYCLKIVTKNEQYFHQSLIEVQLLKYLNKENSKNNNYSLKIFDFFYLNGNLYIITELLGESFYQKFIKTKKLLTISQVRKYTTDLLKNLKFLKDMNIIHCDLKPENIVLDDKKNIAKIIDYGSACFIDDIGEFYIQTRTYRAPEVIMGLPYNQQIDLWSLGCIIFELIKGYNIFDYECSIKNIMKAMTINQTLDINIFKNGQKFEEFVYENKFFFVQSEQNREKYLMIGKNLKEDFFQSISSCKHLNDFIEKCLKIDPDQRMTVEQALNHTFIKNNKN